VRIKELRDKSTEALRKQERDLYDQLFKLRFQTATNQNENPGRIRLARKELARVKTILRERAPEPAPATPVQPGKE
jgi:large subunit ribosomal protein L29